MRDIGHVFLFCLLPLAALCYLIVVIWTQGVARVLRVLAASIWAAAYAYEDFKASWKLHFTETMRVVDGQCSGVRG